jgi:hypothetical protein
METAGGRADNIGVPVDDGHGRTTASAWWLGSG